MRRHVLRRAVVVEVGVYSLDERHLDPRRASREFVGGQRGMPFLIVSRNNITSKELLINSGKSSFLRAGAKSLCSHIDKRSHGWEDMEHMTLALNPSGSSDCVCLCVLGMI